MTAQRYLFYIEAHSFEDAQTMLTQLLSLPNQVAAQDGPVAIGLVQATEQIVPQAQSGMKAIRAS